MTTKRKTLQYAGPWALIVATGLGLFWVTDNPSRVFAQETTTQWISRKTSPIEVALSVATDSCAYGENFIITCSFTNITRNTVRLLAIDLDQLVNPLWMSIDDGPTERGQRIALHSGKDRPGTEDVIEFQPGETIKTGIFLLQTKTLAPSSITSGVLTIKADVGPIIMQGDPRNRWTVATNDIQIDVHTLDKPEWLEFNELDSIITSRANLGLNAYLNGLSDWLTDHTDSALSPRIHYDLVEGWSGRLDALNREEVQAPNALFESIRFCLQKRAPYSNIIGRDYLEFLYVQKRWDLIELAAHRIQERTKVSRLSDSAESYIGSWGALIDTRLRLKTDFITQV